MRDETRRLLRNVISINIAPNLRDFALELKLLEDKVARMAS